MQKKWESPYPYIDNYDTREWVSQKYLMSNLQEQHIHALVKNWIYCYTQIGTVQKFQVAAEGHLAGNLPIIRRKLNVQSEAL